MLRAFSTLAATSLAALSLAACTSNTQTCKDGKCDIDLSGKGAVVTLGGEGGSDLELVSASGKTAKVKIAGKPVELTVGEPLALDNGTLTLEAVEGEDDIQIKVDTTNTQTCEDGKCEISLSGKGSVVTLGGEGGSEMELISASGKTAKVKIAGQEGTLTVGEPINLNNAALTLVSVDGDDKIQVTLDTAGFSTTP